MSWKAAGLTAVALVCGILLARVAQDPETGTASWAGLRAAGLGAYFLLWLSTVSGLALHLRFRPGPIATTWLFELHRITSALSLSFVAGHVAGLLVDPEVAFSALDAVFGVTSGYRPLQVAFGAFAMWSSVAVLVSTGLASRMSYTAWRRLHYLGFPAYALALLHAITSGTDSASVFALLFYASTGATVAAALVARAAGRGWVGAREAA